jgi:hypothetical protein
VDEARAKFENGVLEITVPLQEERKKSREIPIQATTSAQSKTDPTHKAA